MPNPVKVIDQVVNSNGGEEKKPLRIARHPLGYRGIDVMKDQRKAQEKAQELADERKLMRGDRETLMKEALAREAEEDERVDNNTLADEIFGPSVNK